MGSSVVLLLLLFLLRKSLEENYKDGNTGIDKNRTELAV